MQGLVTIKCNRRSLNHQRSMTKMVGCSWEKLVSSTYDKHVTDYAECNCFSSSSSVFHVAPTRFQKFVYIDFVAANHSPAPGLDHPSAKRCKRDPVTSGESQVLDKLLELVGNGGAHVQTAAEIARAVQNDSSNRIHPKLQQLAACGSSGRYDANTERDFQRMMRGANGFCIEPYTITLTLQVSSQQQLSFVFCLNWFQDVTRKLSFHRDSTISTASGRQGWRSFAGGSKRASATRGVWSFVQHGWAKGSVS